jgi:hypothetical protein
MQILRSWRTRIELVPIEIIQRWAPLITDRACRQPERCKEGQGAGMIDGAEVEWKQKQTCMHRKLLWYDQVS